MKRVRNRDAGNLIGEREEFYGSHFSGTIERDAWGTGMLEGPELTDYRDAFKGGPVYVVRSYATPIAWTPATGPLSWTVPTTTYSPTTTQHQHTVRYAVRRAAVAARVAVLV
ncbi:MAG: hypothetical protein ACRDSK_13740 [Actinophytocola sp.]|uniref:hypothetical protein n=1 Tax=Actinophytocola sp. TaxID=1872138 RepID=UPI003D6C66F6